MNPAAPPSRPAGPAPSAGPGRGSSAVIEELAPDAPLDPWVLVLREAFGTVTAQFGWTEETVPSNSAFTTVQKLAGLRRKGLRFFGLTIGGEPAGFTALEDGGGGTFYIERVSVRPRHRHGGLGRRLMEHTMAAARAAGGTKVSVGVVDEHAVLKRWYEDLGFRETARKRFPHLPFTVCFMEQPLR